MVLKVRQEVTSEAGRRGGPWVTGVWGVQRFCSWTWVRLHGLCLHCTVIRLLYICDAHTFLCVLNFKLKVSKEINSSVFTDLRKYLLYGYLKKKKTPNSISEFCPIKKEGGLL